MSLNSVGVRPGPSARDILERDIELAAIGRLFDEALSGHGHTVAIEGPTGIGKSRLLEAARENALDKGLQVFRASAAELERDYPFALVLRLLEARFAAQDPEQQGDLLRGRAAMAAPLLSGAQEPLSLTRTADEFALMHGLYWCVVNLTEQAPTVLLVDDVHWADALSLKFLNYLAQRLEDLPLALMVAIRTDDPTAESELVRRLWGTVHTSLRPAQLSLGAVGELFEQAALPATPTHEFVRASCEVTAGNPFLLHELFTAIRSEPSVWSLADPAEVEAFAPHSVGRGVVLRLTGLGEDALRLATTSAVLSDNLPIATAARIAGLDVDAAVASAERLVAAQILATADPVVFAHPMIRSAVYGVLPAAERRAAHARAARLLHDEHAPPEQIARHLIAGTPIREPWAREALHEGARAAARKGASDAAVRYLRRAVDLSAPKQRTAAVLIDLGLVEAAAGETTSLARFEEALANIDDPQEEARAMYALGQTLYRYGRHSEAATIFRRGAELFGSQDALLAMKFEGAFMCASQYVVPLRDDLTARIKLVSSSLHAPPASAEQRVLLSNVALYGAMTLTPSPSLENQPDPATPAESNACLAREALGDGQLLAVEGSESMALNLAILALLWSGRAAEALYAVDEVLRDARNRGDALAFAEASMVRAMAHSARGNISAAMADAQAAIAGMERGWNSAVPAPQAILADCLIERGDLDSAASVLAEVEPDLLSARVAGLRAWFYLARGRLRLARAQWREAREDLLALNDVLGYLVSPNPAIMPWRSLAAIAHSALGDDREALELVSEELERAEAFGLAPQVGAALRVRGVIEGGTTGRASLEQAVTVLADADAPLELARALFDLGGVDRRAGHRVASREYLRQALDLAHRCGATALESNTYAELLASGARPRRPSLSGADALTPSEQRIADLAAGGQTNRSIAEALFLTKNTVEWHLRHVYRKLGVSSRDELKARMAETTGDSAPS